MSRADWQWAVMDMKSARDDPLAWVPVSNVETEWRVARWVLGYRYRELARAMARPLAESPSDVRSLLRGSVVRLSTFDARGCYR